MRLLWFTLAFLALCGGTVLLPSLDLWASAIFYRPDAGFFLGAWGPFRLTHEGLPYAVTLYVLCIGTIFILSLLRRRAIFGLDSRAAAFLLLSLALGPGLTVNTIFKDHWGRARPAQIAEFGGDKKFTRAFVPADQCMRNCSFPAGDPAMGFYLASIALLVPMPRWRRLGIAASVAVGAGLGVVRLAQGGHFLSDVIASGFITFGMAWLLHRATIRYDGIGVLIAACRAPSAAMKNFLGLTLATTALFFLSYAAVDQPLARYFYDGDPLLHRVFAIVTRFGDSTIYLVPLALALLWALWTQRRTAASRLAYIFGAVAIPGLIADILKPVFGRARPALLFREQLFGFTWRGPHANLWSFPSGHAITITALATALYVTYPPLWPIYAAAALLVAASRVIIEAHYLSDVIAGTYFGFVAAWALAAAVRSKGIKLAIQPEGTLSDIP